MLQSKAGYIDARPLTANSTKTSCDARPDHTLGHKRTSARTGPLWAKRRHLGTLAQTFLQTCFRDTQQTMDFGQRRLWMIVVIH